MLFSAPALSNLGNRALKQQSRGISQLHVPFPPKNVTEQVFETRNLVCKAPIQGNSAFFSDMRAFASFMVDQELLDALVKYFLSS